MSYIHREYFNKLSVDWRKQTAQNKALMEYLTQFGVSDGEWIIDLGAGTGILSQYLKQTVGSKGRVVALDLSENMLRDGLYPEFNMAGLLVCSDVCFLPIRDNVFDKAICFAMLPHVKDKCIALSEIYRILKPGGKLLILHTCCSIKLNRFHATLHAPVCHDVLPKAGDLKNKLIKVGFEPLSTLEKPDLYWLEGEKTI
jgi:demethylmenaquinone methyltransferase/2-methoxy-6-polyprenyl-1,4-benzoquinol methylase